MPDDSLDTTDLVFWIVELQQGRSEAAEPQFRKIMQKVERQARNMFRRFPRVGRFVDVDDVIQNTILRMLAAFRTLRPASRQDFYKLVNSLIRRELLDLTRKYFGPRGAGTREVAPSVEGDPADPTAYSELDAYAQFHAALESLPVVQREVLSLVYYHGWPQTQIAELFQVSVRTVQRWQEDAIKQLRQRVPDFTI